MSNGDVSYDERDIVRRPKVNTSAVADNYASPGEKIVEVSSEAGGGLISLSVIGGKMVIDLYRLDETVEVRAPAANTRTA